MDADRTIGTRLPKAGTAEWTRLAKRLADTLRAGELVLLPAEGLYGLHAAGRIGHARLREAKGDRSSRPFIILISSVEETHRYVPDLPPGGLDLIRSAWPGPLTLVLPAREDVPQIYTFDGTIALRCPGEALLRALAAALAEPLFSTSANRSGQAAPTTYGGVDKALREACAAGVDGGSRCGVGSTLARLEEGGELTIVRSGLWRPDYSS